MNYIVAVIFNDQLFHLSLPEGKSAEISASAKADIVLPDFGHTVAVIAENGTIRISDKEENGTEKAFTVRLNYPRVIDEARRIAVCVSEEMHCESTALLGESFSISLGRRNDGKNGRKNDIVLSSLPFVSRTQFEIVRKNGRTILTDLGSTNGTFVNGKRVKTAELHRGDIISILTAQLYYDSESLRFENVGQEPELADSLLWHHQENEVCSELFKRSPRIQERMPGGKIEIPAPPAEANKPEINWLSTLLPAGVTIAIAVTMALAFQNTMMMLYSLPMTVAGVVVSIANYLRGNKTYRQSSEERRTVYLKKLEEVVADINGKRDAQRNAMLLADPAPEDCLTAVRSRSTTLWCRKPNDTDFISVRLGTGEIPFSVQLECPREQLMEEDELKKKPSEIYRANKTIENMPVICDIRVSGLVGLLGTPELTRTQLQNMILHLTTHHCNTELKLVCFCGADDKEELSWIEDLPHTHGETKDEVYLASTQEEADALFHSFTELFKQRKQEAQENTSYGNAPLFVPYVLFVFFEPNLLKKTAPINQFLFTERELGIGCLMAVQKIAQLPKQCTEIIALSAGKGEMYNTSHASERQEFTPDVTSLLFRRMFGQSMQPLYCDEGVVTSSFPRSFTFYQMLGIKNMSEYDIENSWRASDLLTSELAPSAPIGILESGEQIFFNSPPTGDNGGAHALVAGTNGSGKSETLLTMILSLALRYSPEEVNFLVIDFKGDSIAGGVKGLPHLRGIITNLDGETLNRSLVSINAEINRRQALIKEYNESHPEEKTKISGIRGYTAKYRQGKVKEPLPHLFIVVDEFAQMKKQLPEIMDSFISAAQVGRSLGIKLILATQSPSGVVDNKIRANILKQMCLKVANSTESREMIGTDLAARIKDPGRGYLKIDDSLQLFQSAYGSGKIILPDGCESTQIREALDAIATYCRSHGIHKLPDLFCPPLPTRVEYPKLKQEMIAEQPFGLVPIGIRDDPATQFMGDYSLDVFSRNTLIVGSQLMGKTNLVQTVLRSVAEMYGPEDVNIYILEFASLFLKTYEALPQVGGVVTLQETEKITNLFRLLNEQIEIRRQKFMALGVSTYAAYRESGARDLPQILLLIDNLSAAKEYFPLDNDPLLSICREGLALGISVVATAAQPVGGTTYLPTFANRIALNNNDVMVYNTLLGRTNLRPKELPGRCLVPWENAVYECQAYLAFEGQRETDRTEAIRSFCREQTIAANGKRAKPIPFIPKDLTADGAFSSYPDAYSGGRLMFGLDYATVKPVSIKLAALGVFAVSGRETDVQNFQRYVLTSAEKAQGLQAEFYIIDGIDRSLQAFSRFFCVADYSFLPEQAAQMVQQVRQKAEERYTCVAGGDMSVLDTSPTLVLMLNSAEAINAVQQDKTALESWHLLIGKLRSMNLCIILGALDNASIPFSSEVLKKVKDDRKLLFFDDLGSLKIGDLPYATVKKFATALQKGDGYLILGNEAARIRVPNCPTPEG